MDAMVSADEARDMLDGETRGVHGCSLADATRVGRDILSNAVVYGGTPPALHRACDMLDDVERLARTVIAQAEIIAGRTTAPTDAELAAHEAAGGRWRCVVPLAPTLNADAMRGRAVRGRHDTVEACGFDAMWWPIDADGRPCAWPVTP